MKKYSRFLSVLVLSMTLLYACNFEDKGFTDVTPVSDILIDTTGIQPEFDVDNGGILKISPVITREGSTNADFDYEWRMTKMPGTNLALYDVIGRTAALDTVINYLPSPTPYTLWLKVTHKATGLISGIRWNIIVQTPLMQGLVVADSEDGLQSDLTLIQDTLFTSEWVEDRFAVTPVYRKTEIKRNEYSRIHGNKIEGVVHSLFAQRLYQDGIYRNFLHGASRTEAFRLSTLDYSIIAQGKQLFYDNTIKLDLDRYVQSGSNVIMVNAGKVSVRKPEGRTTVGYNKFAGEMPGSYHANKYLAVHPQLASYAIFYDEGLGKFLRLGKSSINVRNQPLECGVETEPFAPRNLPGYKVLGGGVGNFSEARFVLNKGSYYGVFTMAELGGARNKYDISNAPDIDKAIGFVFPSDQSVVYYATPTKVYSIRIPQGGSVTYTDLYTSPYPITMLEMQRQTGTRTVPNTERCLLAVSYDGAEGRVTTLPIPSSGLGLGLIDAHKAVTFGGFKKISALAIQE